MTKGYWIVRADITDAEKYKEYAAKAPLAVAKFGGKFIVRADESILVEGATRSRNTLIEFPSYQAAIDCWESSAYQDAKKLRLNGGDLDIVIIKGLT
ncbi:DUF1330 domain-containing protein [Agaribacter marinus]|uniref:DUF1330 domain-containing protein n=1 Tax=Agaribacter marinus TaxID=1431249 RepID=A0AA37SW05_9ALTE|nr:DUF1330 domain-containing protein [Agaribacter marinus]GLR69384.1 hypothetical protein GCM10007852_02920 [Agaribacter marinus]